MTPNLVLLYYCFVVYYFRMERIRWPWQRRGGRETGTSLVEVPRLGTGGAKAGLLRDGLSLLVIFVLSNLFFVIVIL